MKVFYFIAIVGLLCAGLQFDVAQAQGGHKTSPTVIYLACGSCGAHK